MYICKMYFLLFDQPDRILQTTRLVQQAFSVRFPGNKIPHSKTIRRIVVKFETYCTVENRYKGIAGILRNLFGLEKFRSK